MRIISFTILLFLFVQAHGQSAYIVYFKDKNGTSFNPYEYFDQKAIERRLLQNIPLNDITDYPVNQQYINEIEEYADSMGTESRWFNFIVAFVSDKNKLQKIKSLAFVMETEQIFPVENGIASYGNDFKPGITNQDLYLLTTQTERMGGKLFDSLGFNGKGIRIAIFDAGFTSARYNPVFEDIRKENRIIATKDFKRKKDGDVYYGNMHGTEVMTCIGGKYMGHKFGLATEAEFLLAKTEVNSEPYYEELNWLAGVEWADKNGAQIINSSLAYTGRRYFTNQMDGKTSLVVRAANMAARKGILVVNAAGNDGDNKWMEIATPADGDSVLTVGGIDPDLDYHIKFASLGPTADKRLKPNVSAYAKVVTSSPNKITISSGTSFSSPLVAGFAACAWQTNRNMTNMQLFHEIEKSGHLYPYFDYAHGYGIPQAIHFIDPVKQNITATFSIVDSPADSSIDVIIDQAFLPLTARIDTGASVSETVNLLNNSESKESQKAKISFNGTDSVIFINDLPSKTIINNKSIGPHAHTDLLFYHIQGKNGILKKYFVIKVEQQDVLTINKNLLEPGDIIRIFYRGYMKEIAL